MDQTLTIRFVSRFEPLALHPRLHHRVGFLIHYLPPREPPPRRISYNSRSTKLLSQYNLHRGQQQPTTTPLPKRLTTNLNHLTLEGYKPISTSTKEGSTTQSPDHLYRRGIHKYKGVYNNEVYNNQPQTLLFLFLFPFSLFPQKQDPNSLG